jgi:hypothetical protein
MARAAPLIYFPFLIRVTCPLVHVENSMIQFGRLFGWQGRRYASCPHSLPSSSLTNLLPLPLHVAFHTLLSSILYPFLSY